MGRFQHGNKAAVGNRGGHGRPPNALRHLVLRDAPKLWRELMRIAFDHKHPLHERHAFAALRTLATFAFPRPQAVTLEASPQGITLWEYLRHVDAEQETPSNDTSPPP